MQNHSEEIPLKQCTKCKAWQPATAEFFPRDRNANSGLAYNCHECNRARAKKHREEHPEVQQKWREEHKDHLRVLQRNAYYRRTGGKPHQSKRKDNTRYCPGCQKWFDDHPDFWHKDESSPDGLSTYCIDCAREKKRNDYYKRGGNPLPIRHRGNLKQCPKCGRWLKATTKYFQSARNRKDGLYPYCKDCANAISREKKYYHKHRYRIRSLEVNFSDNDWQRAIDYFHGCCAVCGRQLSDLFGEHTAGMDHWIPISSPGCPGTIPENIVPLCHGIDGCNNHKHAKDPEQWLNERYGKRKAKRILERINAYFQWVREQNE